MSIAAQINDVIRRVQIDGHGQTVMLERHFDTTAADLWDACIDPQRLASWFEPVEGDLRPGGRYRLTDSGTVGTIERCEPPVRLHVTWEYGGDSSRVVAEIESTSSGGTMLVLTHHTPDDDHWRAYGPAAGGVGWDSSLLALSLRLADDPRAAPEAMTGWSSSEDGRAFVAATTAAWQRAHVEAGADPDVAAEAARRSLDAYLDMVNAVRPTT